jgi:urea transport system permease protein
VALRDDSRRVRAFGYNPVAINVLVFTISAGLAGLAGALFAPIVGIVSPAMIGVVPSIEMVVWVAVGGRGTLLGPILGALLVNGAKSGLSESFPIFWQYFLGALFIGSVLFFPYGIYGFFSRLGTRWRKRRTGLDAETPAPLPLPSASLGEAK